MADEIERRVIYLEINATKAVDGSTAATRALAAIDQGASSAGSALGALEAASNAAGGAVQKTAIDLATAAQSATNLNTAYRTTAGGVLELARAATSAASSAQAQAAGFARLAEQKAAQASLAETRTLMDSVARSTDALAHVYGSATVAATAFATAQSQAAGYGRLAEQNMINAASDEVAGDDGGGRRDHAGSDQGVLFWLGLWLGASARACIDAAHLVGQDAADARSRSSSWATSSTTCSRLPSAA